MQHEFHTIVFQDWYADTHIFQLNEKKQNRRAQEDMHLSEKRNVVQQFEEINGEERT